MIDHTTTYPWELPLGARPRADGTTEFRVWAPKAESVNLALGEDPPRPLEPAGEGVYAVTTEAAPGTDYRFVVDGHELPDPCSRWQPEGLRGPSRVYAPDAVAPFTPVAPDQQVVYELHIGTFSPGGTFESAIAHLPALAELGVTAIEIMPVAEFPGERGWGYDGVYLSSAQSSYGGPAGLQKLVQAAHEQGLAVILDVVYNHVGASGVTALTAYGPYFTGKYETPWGQAINFDDAYCDPVREWVLQSAEGWIEDFGLDGLRLDAIHAIFDSSVEHVVEAVARRVHAVNPNALVIAESGLNDPKVMRPREQPDDVRPALAGEAGTPGVARGRRAVGGRTGYDCDATWADDFHHALRTLITDEREGYYAEFGRVAHLAKAFHRPHVHDGEYSEFRKRRFGAPADDVAPERFVVFSQDHDQVGNRAFGDRLPPEARPLAAFCTLLSPFTPMLFMGEEYGENAPFQFFCDHIDPEIAEATRNGRRAEFAAFASFGEEIPDPQSPETFAHSKLTRETDRAIARLYAELLRVRRELPPGDVDAVAFNEEQKWLRLSRGPFELLCNFGSRALTLERERPSRLVLGTDEQTRVTDRRIELAPLSGALVT
ncbi:MAG: alpha-amylase family glycosyl hydrolase [Actinomycetota bacterium]|nr:alpha-amylase family glycosyl hydrolase [Actinomycetota bacterium]